MKNYYDTLGITRNTTARQLKKRFLELARERHPDRFQGVDKARAEAEFQEITEAFNVLSNPAQRRRHDEELRHPHPVVVNDPRQVARVFLSRGIKAFKAQEYLEAASNFHRATEIDSNDPRAWHHLARTCLEKEHWLPKAREAIERACELEPDKAPYLKLAGRVYERSGMTARAKEYYNRALQVGGPNVGIREALQNLGSAPDRSPGSKPKTRLMGKSL